MKEPGWKGKGEWKFTAALSACVCVCVRVHAWLFIAANAFAEGNGGSAGEAGFWKLLSPPRVSKKEKLPLNGR